jgi:DNA primase
LGTALGEAHLQLLRRFTDSITLVLDGDDAGRRRTNEILDALLALFEKNQVDLRILTLPQGLDPCDFIAQHGSDSFRELLTQAVDALEHKFRTVTNGLDTLTDTHRATQAAEELVATLAKIRPASSGATSQAMLREEQMLSRIARQFHLPEEQLRNRLAAVRREGARPRASKPRDGGATIRNSVAETQAIQEDRPPRLSDLSAWERELLELLLLEPALIVRVADAVSPDAFAPGAAQKIFSVCCGLMHNGKPCAFGEVLAVVDDPSLKSLLVSLDESSAKKASADRERWLADLLLTHRRRSEKIEHRRVLATAREDASEAEQLLASFCEQTKSKHLSEYERRKK